MFWKNLKKFLDHVRTKSSGSFGHFEIFIIFCLLLIIDYTVINHLLTADSWFVYNLSLIYWESRSMYLQYLIIYFTYINVFLANQVLIYQTVLFYFVLLLPLISGLIIYLSNFTSLRIVRSTACVSQAVISYLLILFTLSINSGPNAISLAGNVFETFIKISVSQEVINLFSFGCDPFTIVCLFLTVFTINLCFLCSWDNQKYLQLWFGLFFLSEFILFGVFTSMNIFAFYIFFEAVLIPMYLIIGLWGSEGEKKILAAYYFFFFTLLGSMSMLISLLYLAVRMHLAGYNISDFTLFGQYSLLDVHYIIRLTETEQVMLLLGTFLGFAVKVPLLPFHLWLPEAHVEAPAAGSVLLAGVLLKLGGYGLFRFMYMFPLGIPFVKPVAYTLALISVLYTSLTIFVQPDIKKIIAYTSIGHMSYVIFGFFSQTVEGTFGAIFMMFTHGLISSALFICIGVLYERFKTRAIHNFSQIIETMPVFSFFLFFFLLANCAIPPFASFVAELSILVGLSKDNFVVALGAGFSVILTGIYSLWLYNRLAYSRNPTLEIFAPDLSPREFFMLAFIAIAIFVLGVYPVPLYDFLYESLTFIITRN